MLCVNIFDSARNSVSVLLLIVFWLSCAVIFSASVNSFVVNMAKILSVNFGMPHFLGGNPLYLLFELLPFLLLIHFTICNVLEKALYTTQLRHVDSMIFFAPVFHESQILYLMEPRVFNCIQNCRWGALLMRDVDECWTVVINLMWILLVVSNCTTNVM